ncbi:MAG TPA: TIGR01777 family oxidoreductase [Acidimicrobiales bacterium]|jgi:hypothetical protein|nr:TIGR01777 family oxidoreductase [Acidimicrobiales bacterium]
MTFEHSAVIDRPLEEVFAWHSRPGAIRRLTPPWQPVKVDREADSLEDGRAVLRLPARLRWIADHERDGYRPGRQFADRLTTPLLGQVLRWRHTHDFSPEGTGSTRITDRVETRMPERFLREMFAYRTRQVAGDLHSHATINPAGRRLTVAVTGSSGLIGTALSAFLTTGGHQVVRLVRGGPGDGARHWDTAAPAPDLLDGVDAVVHLAGATIAGRFTAAHKAEVRDSRIEPTRRLAELAARAGVPVFVSASAIGYYGADRGDEELDETAGRGDGFLADLVADWEEAAGAAGGRVVQVRTGIVQSPSGGALQLQRLLFQAGLGGRLGDGRQWFAWIAIDDLLDIYLRALLDDALAGPVNAAAPGVVRNEEYTRVLAKVVHRPAVLPVPDFGPALLLGKEGASEVAAASQRVIPTVLERAGHRFRYPQLEPALRHVLGRSRGTELAV